MWELKDWIDQMFVGLFATHNLPTLAEMRSELDTSQYDAAGDTAGAAVAELSAATAAAELHRKDDGVEFTRNFAILRRMMADDQYRDAVLSEVAASAAARGAASLV